MKATTIEPNSFWRADWFLDGATKLSIDDIKKATDPVFGPESHRLTLEILGESFNGGQWESLLIKHQEY